MSEQNNNFLNLSPPAPILNIRCEATSTDHFVRLPIIPRSACFMYYFYYSYMNFWFCFVIFIYCKSNNCCRSVLADQPANFLIILSFSLLQEITLDAMRGLQIILYVRPSQTVMFFIWHIFRGNPLLCIT